MDTFQPFQPLPSFAWFAELPFLAFVILILVPAPKPASCLLLHSAFSVRNGSIRAARKNVVKMESPLPNNRQSQLSICPRWVFYLRFLPYFSRQLLPTQQLLLSPTHRHHNANAAKSMCSYTASHPPTPS
ncbi:hypothetical protein AC578_7632 [Pseudocercospora eumusae]|uniref:Uncharacterized protein n=1 Tax=Pseudocercospora eumusae TaxID=321146 RepID=A0A139H5T9_9PEZI|nr:hypothetical protein AC578_7632 [Pseudocercospora eumusae]